MAGIDDACGGDDGRAVLIVMEDGNVEFFAQAALDDKTIGRTDILKVDAAPCVANVADRADKVFGIRRVHFNVDTVDIGEAFEEDRLAFHDRLGGHVSQVSETEDRRPIGDHRDHVALGRVVIRLVGVLCDRQHRNCHARTVGQRQVALCSHGLGGRHGDFAGCRFGVEIECFLISEAWTFGGHGEG